MTTARRTRCSVSLNTVAFPGLIGGSDSGTNAACDLDTGDEAQGTMSGITGGRDRGHGGLSCYLGSEKLEFVLGNDS